MTLTLTQLADRAFYFDPMLASAMTVDAVTGAAFDARYAEGWALEEKLDGHRCVVLKVGSTFQWQSRPNRGKPAIMKPLPAHIAAAMSSMEDGAYDGELVNSAPGASSSDVTRIGARLIFVAFDVLTLASDPDVAGRSYEDRRYVLLCELAKMPADQRSVSTVESLTPTWATVEAIWARGGEGAILKRVGSTYGFGYRGPDWVKVKRRIYITMTVVGFKAGKNGWRGGTADPYAALKLRADDGSETTVKTPDDATLRAIAANPSAFLGRRVVIHYQQRMATGGYRHPMFDHWAGVAE